MALLRNSKDIFENAMKVLRIIQGMTPARQMQVLAAAQMMVNIEAAGTQEKPEVNDE
jgi:hypothetical protein